MSLDKNLKLSIADGCFYSFMVGLGETYIAAFMLAKGYSALSASLISTLPLLLGGILQLFSPLFIARFKSYKKWVVKTSFTQGLSLIILSATAFLDLSVYWIFFIVSLYWAGGMSTGPAWNSWMTELVDEKIKLKFFSLRSTLSSFSVLIGLVVGGIFLQKSEDLLSTFFILFFVAGLCRMTSSYFLSQHTESEKSCQTIQENTLRTVFKSTLSSNQKGLLLFILIFLLGVHFSSCFFNPFMLKELKLSFQTYMFLLSSSFIAKVISQSVSKKIIERVGLKKALLISALGIVPLPLVWVFNHSFEYLLAMQFLSGFMWGLYELVIFLIIFSEVPVSQRTNTLSIYNLIQTGGMVLGSTLGGILFNNIGANPYYSVFIGSTILRFIAIGFFPGIKINKMHLKNIFIIKASGERLSRGEAPQIVVDKIAPVVVKESKPNAS